MSTSAAPGPRGTLFERYAGWYDAFNQAKSYDAEAAYVLSRVSRITGGLPKRWLDVGCGTGQHLAQLQRRGIDVEGVDRSASMIERAKAAHPDIRFHVATAQDFALDRNHDVVTMLFHVLNYQVAEEMVTAALERIAAHLAPGGVFAFDFWNSDAVLRDPPVPRVRTAQVDGRTLYRLSTPFAERDRHLITIRFQFRWDSPEGELACAETHVLRHFSQAELQDLLGRAGLTLETCDAWMTDRPLADTDWYGFVCARQ